MSGKKLLAIALTAAMFLSAGSGAFAASSETDDDVKSSQTTVVKGSDVGPRVFGEGDSSGSCGDAMTWSYDDKTSVLTISGSGEMTSHPWEDYKENIVGVKFSGNITSICDDAFSDCKNLSKITIPASIVTICGGAFYNCMNLESISFASGSKLSEIKSNYDYWRSGSDKTHGAFEGCTNLERIVLPDSVTVAESDLFQDCKNLETVVLGKNLQAVPSWAFYNCSNLTSVTIGANTTAINQKAFLNCKNLESITIPDNIKIIENNVFEDCTCLTSIKLGSSLESIGDYAFLNCALSAVTIPASVTTLGSSFYGVKSLKSVIFNSGSKLSEIKTNYDYWRNDKYQGTFEGTGLEKIVLPDSLTGMGREAFENCENLKTVTLGKNLEAVSSWAFHNCTNLATVTIGTNTAEINDHAFCDCSKLTNVTIGTNTTTIKDYAFQGCTALKTITIPNRVSRIESYVFEGCSSLSSIKLGSSLASIGDYAFLDSGLVSITIPASVTSIGSSFYGLKTLKSVTFEAGSKLTEMKTNYDYWRNDRYQGTFEGCTSLTQIVIPDNVNVIQTDSFYGCFGLKTVTVGKHVTDIESSAFGGCSALTTVVLPKALITVEANAFSNCSSLNTVKFTGSKTRWNSLKEDGINTDGNSYLLNAPKFIYEYSEEMPTGSITVTPSNSLTDGDIVTFTVNASGSGFTYQWQYKKSGQTAWNNWGSRTTASTTATVNLTWDGMQVRCILKNSAGNSVSSNVIPLSVTPKLIITQNPDNIAVKVGDTAKFTVKATGAGTLTYQWYFKKDGQTAWSKWNGHTTATTTATAGDTWNKMQVRCVVKDTAGKSVTSSAATVTIATITVSAAASPSTTLYAGDSVTFKATASGTGLTYQWYYKKSGQTAWSAWNGRTTASTTATANTSWNGMQVKCIVKNSAGNSVSSNILTLKVTEKAAITTQPDSVVVVADGATAKFSLKATGTGTLKYQWYYKKSGQTAWNAWNNKNTASTSAVANSTWDGMQVRCVVKDSNSSVTSSASTVYIKKALTITSHPVSVTTSDGKTVSFTVKATGTGVLKYQWYYKKSGGSWTKWNGHTTATTTATANSTWNGMKVYCIVTDSAGSTAVSNSAAITVKKAPVITQQPANVTVYSGKNVSFTVKATGTGTLKYQWYIKKSGQTSWTLWNNHTTATTTATSNDTWNKMQVRCVVTDSNGSTTSSAATVTIAAQLKITANSQNVVVSAGKNTTFTVKATGTGLKYQWYFKKAGGSWTLWNGRTTASTTATANSSWDEMQVRCLVTDATGNKVYSGIATVYVM